jgi:protein-disulfide isomerase
VLFEEILFVVGPQARGRSVWRPESTQANMASSLTGADLSSQPFTGSYRIGPEQTPVRVVIFSDYQCPFCGILGKQARELVEERSDVSLLARHYPLCTDSNKHTQKKMHPNVCEAARAAEAAPV